MVDWFGLVAAAIVGSSVGGTIGYFIHLKSKARDKHKALEMIGKQKHKDFIIPEKYVENNKVKMRGVRVNLDEYCGIKPKETEGLDTQEPDEEYNDYATTKESE